MPLRMRTRSVGWPATESLRGGTGVRVGRGGRVIRQLDKRESMGGATDILGFMPKQLQKLFPAMLAQGYSYKEFLGCNPKEYDGKGGVVVLTRWIEKKENVQDISGCNLHAKNWKAPRTPIEVRSFLGLAGYYRRFIENFSKIAKSLTILTQKGKVFDWGEEQELAFQTLKDKLCNAPILALPSGPEDFVVYCDASGIGLGCVLMQRGKVIAYELGKLKHSLRRNYYPRLP
ncbi:putative reverse transcriptase domain-containing protein [Tanacetum coccineum]